MNNDGWLKSMNNLRNNFKFELTWNYISPGSGSVEGGRNVTMQSISSTLRNLTKQTRLEVFKLFSVYCVNLGFCSDLMKEKYLNRVTHF